MEQRWRVSISPGACYRSGICTSLAAGYFRAGADGKAQVVAEVLGADEKILDAAEFCPGRAISVLGADSGADIQPTS
jgi:ferredoxin